MPLYRPFFNSAFPSNEINNLLSLLDVQPVRDPQLRRHLATGQGPVGTFSPRFDIKETKNAYELHGELPGIERKDVSIEFSEGNTMTIRGRTDYTRTEGSRPSTPAAAAVDEEGYEALEHSEHAELSEHTSQHYRKPSVEDAAEPGENSSVTVEPAKKDLVKAPSAGEVAKEKARYWLTERSVGEFHRSFEFPVPVDRDNVKATFKNGILSLTVPKAEKPKVRHIEIQ